MLQNIYRYIKPTVSRRFRFHTSIGIINWALQNLRSAYEQDIKSILDTSVIPYYPNLGYSVITLGRRSYLTWCCQIYPFEIQGLQNFLILCPLVKCQLIWFRGKSIKIIQSWLSYWSDCYAWRCFLSEELPRLLI